MKLLHLDSSILGPNSVSRALSAEIVAREAALHPGLEVVYRDLAADKTLHLSGAHLAAWQGGPVEDTVLGQDLAHGGAYLDELLAADILVIGAPMYNFTVPSQLKAWIDRVAVVGKTFRYSEAGAEGLLKGRKAFIASARGGIYQPGSPTIALEHQETYLTGVLAFMGITDVTIVRAEGIAFGPEAREAALAKARAEISAIAA
ncbi:FMN-dependent NADH-azoreductase [Aquabacter sp. CN5-332]|uniref:FMN-dependent NADH-azoreductase n=1 Tax=Aquabacter sp. CN5-332 TaxID=3156608 RepID=UPI0032B57D90